MKKTFMAILTLGALSCQKETEQASKMKFASEADSIIEKGTHPILNKTLSQVKDTTIWIYKRDGYVSRPTITGTEATGIGTLNKLLLSLDSAKYENTAKRVISSVRVTKTTAIQNTMSIGYATTATDPQPTSYQYHITIQYDYTWPAINYEVTVWWNSANGHVTSAMVTTNVWGLGNYNYYTPITTPPPFVTINGNTITWDAMGTVNVGVNLNYFGISGFNFSSNITMEYLGWLETDPSGGTNGGVKTENRMGPRIKM